MSKVLTVVVCVVLFLAVFAIISSLMGLGASWVLSFFGVHVPWYVCSVAIFILGSVFKGTAHVAK